MFSWHLSRVSKFLACNPSASLICNLSSLCIYFLICGLCPCLLLTQSNRWSQSSPYVLLLLSVPQTHLKTWVNQSFQSAAPKLWNNLWKISWLRGLFYKAVKTNFLGIWVKYLCYALLLCFISPPSILYVVFFLFVFILFLLCLTVKHFVTGVCERCYVKKTSLAFVFLAYCSKLFAGHLLYLHLEILDVNQFLILLFVLQPAYLWVLCTCTSFIILQIVTKTRTDFQTDCKH